MTIQDLQKSYGDVRAVDHLSFGIPQGVCFGLLGPNGAGKTTTIEMLEGVTAPTGGQILFRGQPVDPSFRQKVGIQFQQTSLPEFITVKETIELFSAFYPNPRSMEELVSLCSLSDILERDNQKLSGGQRQRMLLALAVIPRPEIVFLDEPTTGLDPQARRNFWDLVRGIKAEGTTVVLTTHYMDEAEILCDLVAIVDHGRLLELDSPQALLKKHFHGALVRLPDREIQTDDLDGTLKSLLKEGVDLTGLSIHKPDLEDLFIKLTGTTLRA
jgi:ABC-2 type transport system ATP-binding protein